jgi:thioesterase domain-containing protein
MSRGYRARFARSILKQYRPKIYSGRICFLKSNAPVYRIRSAPQAPDELCWSGVASGGFEIHELHGDHMEIVKDPLAAKTAEAILSCVRKIEADSNPSGTYRDLSKPTRPSMLPLRHDAG